LIGCSAGFVNIAKIKGTHNAMKSGMVAAEAAFDAITGATTEGGEGDMSAYEKRLKESWVWSDLNEVRNLRPSFNTPLGIWGGVIYSGIDTLLLKGRTPWTFHNPKLTDAQHTQPASRYKPIAYPAPQPPLSTDLLTSVALTGTNHAEDQLVHLRLPEEGGGKESARKRHVRVNVGEYAGLLGRACPAAVYEYVEGEGKEVNEEGWEGKKLVINSQVCVFLWGSSGVVVTDVWGVRIVYTASCAILKCKLRI
jgi:electron-transferring-flavoprotein dehydrogenase